MLDEKKVEKKYPGDVCMDKPTFLNDSKIDGELYNYLLSISVGYSTENKETGLKEGHTII